ncbi:MAG: UDP-2,3-diacetamido-2,3-dideoxy-D-glucuronic acid 2-epimerase, partial [uncultured Solirubrobacteraceae bacterium]
EGPHRHRQPAAVRQGGGGVADPARRARGVARPHGPAPRRRLFDRVLRGAADPAPGDRARHPRRVEHVADRADARGARADRPRRRTRRRARLRRHELHARRRPRERAGRCPRLARRGGHAVVRPAHARGAQPGARRPPVIAPARAVADRGRQPAGRTRRGRRRARRRRHGRHGLRDPADRAGHAAAVVVPFAVRPRHRAPRGQRRRSRPPARARRAAARGAAQGRPAAAPAHPRSARGRRPARRGRTPPPRAAAARLPGLHVAARPRAGGAHGLRGRAEGGLPRRRAVRDAARHDGVGRDGLVRVERAGGPRRFRGGVRSVASDAVRAARALRRREGGRARRRGTRLVRRLAL